jgi:hypothetical protein
MEGNMKAKKAKNPVQRPKLIIVRATAVEKAQWQSAALARDSDLSKLVRNAVRAYIKGDGDGAPPA